MVVNVLSMTFPDHRLFYMNWSRLVCKVSSRIDHVGKQISPRAPGDVPLCKKCY